MARRRKTRTPTATHFGRCRCKKGSRVWPVRTADEINSNLTYLFGAGTYVMHPGCTHPHTLTSPGTLLNACGWIDFIFFIVALTFALSCNYSPASDLIRLGPHTHTLCFAKKNNHSIKLICCWRHFYYKSLNVHWLSFLAGFAQLEDKRFDDF